MSGPISPGPIFETSLAVAFQLKFWRERPKVKPARESRGEARAVARASCSTISTTMSRGVATGGAAPARRVVEVRHMWRSLWHARQLRHVHAHL